MKITLELEVWKCKIYVNIKHKKIIMGTEDQYTNHIYIQCLTGHKKIDYDNWYYTKSKYKIQSYKFMARALSINSYQANLQLL